MFAPVRQPLALRTSFPPGLLVSAAAVSVMFTATPFLLPELGRAFGVSTASLGWFSAAQVATFAIASFGAGRLLSPSHRLLVVAGVVFAVANVASVFVGEFWLLVGVRGLAGLASGTVNWIAWGQAARQPAAMGRVAAIGPIAATVGSLAFGPLIAWAGYQAVFGAIAVVGGLAVLLPASIESGERVGGTVSDSKSNRVLLIAAGLLTLFASSAFVFLGIRLEVLGAAPWVLSIAMAGNAVAGFLATRNKASRAWVWFVLIGACAAIAFIPGLVWPVVVAVWVWGFAFWMGIPRLLRLVEERSDRPGERTGDAQGLMAVGRILGPILGGTLEGVGGFVLVGTVAAVGVTAAGSMVGGVELQRSRAGR